MEKGYHKTEGNIGEKCRAKMKFKKYPPWVGSTLSLAKVKDVFLSQLPYRSESWWGLGLRSASNAILTWTACCFSSRTGAIQLKPVILEEVVKARLLRRGRERAVITAGKRFLLLLSSWPSNHLHLRGYNSIHRALTLQARSYMQLQKERRELASNTHSYLAA